MNVLVNVLIYILLLTFSVTCSLTFWLIHYIFVHVFEEIFQNIFCIFKVFQCFITVARNMFDHVLIVTVRCYLELLLYLYLCECFN